MIVDVPSFALGAACVLGTMVALIVVANRQPEPKPRPKPEPWEARTIARRASELRIPYRLGPTDALGPATPLPSPFAICPLCHKPRVERQP